MGALQDKVAIVLGAAGDGNMGQVIARQYAAEGAKVVVAGRNIDRFKPFADEIGGSAFESDITSRDDMFALVDFAKKTYGKVDIGVNATGWGLLKSLTDTTEADLDKMVAIQFKGPYFFFQALIGAMDKGGSIIQISSATATIMLEAHSAYMGTKAGIDHVIRTIANEYGTRGIRANSISPGVTATPMAGDSLSYPPVLEAFVKEYPLGRIGTADDIAHAAVWLARDECFMSGTNLQVNGGLTLRRNPSGAELFSVMPAAAIAHLTS
ncbi:MAG: short-chain dehydrogenase/reductase [Sphingomonadales bacterium]|nr:short-chain dehydrogenase/reductase [Sphingomonadales bacterium]